MIIWQSCALLFNAALKNIYIIINVISGSNNNETWSNLLRQKAHNFRSAASRSNKNCQERNMIINSNKMGNEQYGINMNDDSTIKLINNSLTIHNKKFNKFHFLTHSR